MNAGRTITTAPATEVRGPEQPAMRRTALVTGASSGIGEAYATRLAAEGYDVALVARRRDRLETLAAKLRAESAVQATVIGADLTDLDDVAKVEQYISGCETFEFLVNCAGIAGYMPFIELPPALAMSMIMLHIATPTRLTRAALPGMIERGHGVIVNVSSGLAFSAALPAPPLPHRAVYAGAKAYTNTFTEILANELRGTGVHVQVLCPGIVRTELHKVANFDVSHVPDMMEPDAVVAASLRGIELGETVCIPALGDPAQHDRFSEARTQILASIRRGEMASRYIEGNGA